jgi:hypothetical protein
MFLQWIIRLVIISGAFYLHWIVGVLIIYSLVIHMKSKANGYDKKYNLNLKKTPWIYF